MIVNKPFSVKIAISSNPVDYAIAVLYTFIIQALTGIPKPEYLKHANVNELLVLFSQEVYDYPFWLQDLSHFPLFFVFTWLWARCIGPISKESWNSTIYLLIISLGYSIVSEVTQIIIPNRFPSIEDLIMNLSGALTGLLCHKYYCVVIQKRLLN